MLVNSIQIADRHILEKDCCVFTNLLSACHQRVIGIHLRCLFVIISGSNLCNVMDSGTVSVCDQADLGVYLIPLESVQNTASGLFQTLGPVNVVLLIKTCSQLDQNCDFFSVLSRCAEIFYKSCFLRQTVDRDLDRQNFRVC